MKTWNDIRLAIGLCNSQDKIDSDFFWNFLNLQKPKNAIVLRGISRHKFISLNEITKKAAEAKAEKILFLDIDMRFPLNTIPQLLSHDLPIVSGLYYLKNWPFSPIAGYYKGTDCVNSEGKKWKEHYAPLPENPNHLTKVDWTGIGCLLVDMDVFNKIYFPCFREQWSRNNNIRKRGHDIIFGDDVKKAGYDIYVDTKVDCIHTPSNIQINKSFVEAYHASNFDAIEDEKAKEYTTTSEYWDSVYAIERIEHKNRYYKDQYAYVMENVKQGSKVADIGCGRGLFLRVLKKEKNCECFGYDLSQEAINELKQYGIEGWVGDFSKHLIHSETERYASIIISHVIEHLKEEDIDPFMKGIVSIMNDWSEAFFLVPTFEKKGELWLEHRRIYNQKTLSELMKKYFQNISIKKIGKGLIAKVNNIK